MSKVANTAKSRMWVYDRLVCEFQHWDQCLTGLIEDQGSRYFVRIVDSQSRRPQYMVREIDWTPECDEYMDDYRKAFGHWFHEGKPRAQYDGKPLQWFVDKWQKRNPIEQQVKE